MADDAWHKKISEHVADYVYVLVDPRDRKPFYVGRGKGMRVFAHGKAAAAAVDEISPKLERIRAIRAAGLEPQLQILRHGLTEEQAKEVESATIDALTKWSGPLDNAVGGFGREKGLATVADLAELYNPQEAPPLEYKTLLVPLNRTWHRGIEPGELQEITTEWWTVGMGRVKAWPVQVIMGVWNSVIRSAYAVDGWEEDRTGKRRRAIVHADPALEKYVDHHVDRHLQGIRQWRHLYVEPETEAPT